MKFIWKTHYHCPVCRTYFSKKNYPYHGMCLNECGVRIKRQVGYTQ